MFAILHHEWVHDVADIPCQFLASRERGWAAGSSNITFVIIFVIISSARNTGLASATRAGRRVWLRNGRAPEAGDYAAALVWSFQALASHGGFFGPVAQPDRATVS